MSDDSPIPQPDPCRATLPTLLDFQTRFLYPFSFNRHLLPQAAAALQQDNFRRGNRKPHRIWKASAPPKGYREELLDRVSNYLFLSPHGGGCVYLQANEVTSTWFRHTTLQVQDGKTLTVRMAPGPSLELFLSPQGVGVLSLALVGDLGDRTPGTAQLFNYALSRLARTEPSRLHNRHPQDDIATWQRILPEKRREIPPPPPDSAVLEDRLTIAGGNYHLSEVISRLLRSLERHGLKGSALQNFVIYTVVRLGPEVRFRPNEPNYGAQMALASSLALGRRSPEQGGHTGEVQVQTEILRDRHLAAVGLFGAVHMIADEAGDLFNDQYVRVARDRYFIPYLISLFQRLALDSSLEELRTIHPSQGSEAGEQLGVLRDNLLPLGAGHLRQVSARQGLQHFARLARVGQGVPDAWREVRQGIADLDADFGVYAAVRQDRLTQGVAQNLRAITRVQEMIHLIEYFLVSVYSAHFWYMFAEENENITRHNWLGLPILSLGVAVSAAVGFSIVFTLNWLLKRDGHTIGQEDEGNSSGANKPLQLTGPASRRSEISRPISRPGN
jgi:hypothetical protein